MSVYNVNGSELTAIYDKTAASLDYGYDKTGSTVFIKNTRSVEDVPVGVNELYSITNVELNASTESPQGMAIYNGHIFQYFSDKKIRIFDEDDYSLVNTLSCTNIGHGNGFQFAETIESNGYPICYVNDGNGWSASPYVYRLSLTPSAVSKLSTITMSVTGYLPNCTIDFATDTMYILSQATTSYSTAGDMYLTVFDMDSQTKTAEYTLQYLGVEQGLAYRNGKLIISCSHYSDATTYFYIVNVETGAIENTYSYAKTTMEEYEDFQLVECVDGYYLISSNWQTVNNVKSYRLMSVRFA